MPFCAASILTTDLTNSKVAFPLRCRSWNCPRCIEQRRAELFMAAKSGNPNRFVTLTRRRVPKLREVEAAQQLVAGWRAIVQWERRQNENATFDFFAVFEETKLGWPHLHALCRSPWIDQAHASEHMRKKYDSPIVHVERINSPQHGAAYLASYIKQAPKKFGTLKRYWQTRGYCLDQDWINRPRATWRVEQTDIESWCRTWRNHGWLVIRTPDGGARVTAPGVHLEEAQ